MKKVIEKKTQISDKLNVLLPKIDFADTFATTNHIDSIERVTNLIFNTTPKWVGALFKLRNWIVQLFWLKTDIPVGYSEDFKIGGYVKFFKIYELSDDEIVLGMDDSHLNFRAIVQNDKNASYNIKLITLVEYNNRLGRIYMAVVKPFHRLVVKHLLKNCFKKI